jgi:tripartite-type tricarboxylate transporter receptor subunit TctC
VDVPVVGAKQEDKMGNRILPAIAVAAGLSIAATAASVWSEAASAQPYPSRPITIIVPFPPGGGLDVTARIMAPHMSAVLGQPVIVENSGGAAGSIGVGKAVRANPDGYTLSIGITSTHVFNGAMYKLPYDLLDDLEPISLIASTPQIFVAKKSVPAEDLRGLMSWLKANPDKASQATAGLGSAGHVAGILFQQQTGTSFQFIPFRGLGPAMQGLLGDQVDMMIDVPASSLPQLRAGRIKAFAVAAKTRLAAAPEIPTVDEAGLPGFYAPSWYGLWAPKGMAKDVVAKLNAAVVTTLANPEVRAQFDQTGFEIYPRDQQTPEALHAYQKAEIEKWWPIIKAANIVPKD